MAFKAKKKTKQLSLEEQAFVKSLIESTKRFNKPYKGEIVYKNSKSSQEFVWKARYNNESELEADAKELIARMNKVSPEKKWSAVSMQLLNKNEAIDEENSN